MDNNGLPIVELLGKNWFVDEKLKEFRDVNNPSIVFDFKEMDDALEIDHILKNPIDFGINIENENDAETLEKFKRLFDRVMNGDISAFEEMAEI